MHDPLCDDRLDREPSTNSESVTSVSPSGVYSHSELMSRITELLNSIPEVDADLDIVSARGIVDAVCRSNGLPLLDDKRFMLLFSRFAAGSVVPRSKSRQFFYLIFKRIYNFMAADTITFKVSRYFFIVKNTKVTKHYRFKAVVGQGSFGVVHRVIHIASGQERVCKSVAKGASSVPMHQLEAEIRIIAQLDHPNVIRMYEYFEDDSHVHLIMENCRSGDLLGRIKQSIKGRNRLPLPFIISIMRQILSSLAFMKNNRIIHKDLKPENIMLIETVANPHAPIVKVIDFGLSEIFAMNQETSTTVAGTAFYMAPEIFRPPFNHKCDTWSCGVIAFFMLTGFLPFFGATVGEVKSNVLYRRLQWPASFAGSDQPLDVPEEARDFIEKILEKDARLRLGASEALKHPWIAMSAVRRNKHLFCLPVALNIRSFSRLSFLKRAVINLTAHIWEFQESENIREVFTELDSRQRGFITIPELADALQVVGLCASDAWRSAKAVDLTGTGQVTYTALTAGVISPLLDSDKRIVEAVFNTFNPNKKGKISTQSMWEILSGHRCAFVPSTDSQNMASFMNLVGEEMKADPSVSILRMGSAPNSSQSSTGALGVPYSWIDMQTFRDWMLAAC